MEQKNDDDKMRQAAEASAELCRAEAPTSLKPNVIKPNVIKPTPGRIVHFYLGVGEHTVTGIRGIPLAAIIAAVHTDRLVNLMVVHADGRTSPMQNVRLFQPGDDDEEALAYQERHNYAEWMPFQQGQALASQAPGAPDREIRILQQEVSELQRVNDYLRDEIQDLRNLLLPTEREQPDPGEVAPTGAGSAQEPEPGDEHLAQEPEPAEGTGGSAPGQEEPDNKE